MALHSLGRDPVTWAAVPQGISILISLMSAASWSWEEEEEEGEEGVDTFLSDPRGRR